MVKPSSTRVLLALAAIYHWHVHQGDVKTAFLNGELDKPVAIRPPKDVIIPKGFILLTFRALYGLKVSARAWYNKFRATLIKWGWRMSAYDPCVFIHDEKFKILEVHVDDINVMGSDLQDILDFKEQLSSVFAMTDGGECSWYLGMHVEQKKPGEIWLHQKKYIDDMVKKYGFEDTPAVKTPLDKNVKLSKAENYTAALEFQQDYQSKVGSYNFAANQTRPDISFATSYVARYMSNPNQDHMDAANRVIAYLKDDPRKPIIYTD